MRTKPDEKRDALADEIAALTAEIKGLRKERDVEAKANSLTDQVNNLKKQIADLEINKSKLTEEHSREKREVEHMVGLQKKRADFEQESGRREAVLEVREENLSADKDRFEDHVKFIEKRFADEVGYLKDIMGQILDRLPSVTVGGAVARPATRTAKAK